ncbi:NAD(P)/FAD-dependent oxidoreductase [Steroidobacter cummioxidans]|uniref:NAD(P)/FAD-dependent oxidoreductase n=1 Tax=Steroidobacter cummioxidans TaxID=1803913 RepID=UPI000E310FE1|nr:NAD(P)/FAD-dependent oxidoreductase [Steroidobacter cummioxidans]
MEQRDVIVVGAGPSGAISSALLKRQGWNVLVLEGQRFPRFSIGESLLTHCLDFVAEAGMLPAIERAGFQFKNGAAFVRGDEYGEFDFGDKFTPGRNSTFQVQRAVFDKVLADEAERQGVEIRYETRVIAVDNNGAKPRVRAVDAKGMEYEVEGQFVLDASGFGRVLPKLLNLETPSKFPVRNAVFTHVADGAAPDSFDRNKIQIVVHPQYRDVWFWLIPFANGRCSLGCVAAREFFANYPAPLDERLKKLVSEEPFLTRVLANATWDTPARELSGYAANVKSMHGKGFALLGNAAEFLDPVFSSGVTIAMRSASMAAAVLNRQLRGETVDWTNDFEIPLRKGVDTFRAYVTAWYDGRFQDIMFAKHQPAGIRGMICAILAGYAWDESNPFVAEPERRLDMVAKLCAA